MSYQERLQKLNVSGIKTCCKSKYVNTVIPCVCVCVCVKGHTHRIQM